MGGNQGAAVECDNCGRRESIGRLGERKNGAKSVGQLVAEGWTIPGDLCPDCSSPCGNDC